MILSIALAGIVIGGRVCEAAPMRFANPQLSHGQKKKRTKANRRSTKAARAAGFTSSRDARKNHQSPAETQTPQKFIDARVQKVIADLGARPIRTATVLTRAEVDTAANRQQFLHSIYTRGLVDASWSSAMMADKLIMARLLERELGARAKIYYPKTMGLREFLIKKNLVERDGVLIRNGDRIEAALHDEFPMGYVVRPAVGVAPTETMAGLFPGSDQFIVELLKTSNPIYDPKHLRQPVSSHLLNEVASGEALVIQESIVGTADIHRPLKRRQIQEIRVHTFEGRVVENSVPQRWGKGSARVTSEAARQAEGFVADFLKSLPLSLVNRQAWAVNVALADNGDMRVMDIVTNAGNPSTWSGSLDQPRVLGAYARHFENYYGLKFSGLSGTLLRHNFGNYVSYWGKRIDRAKPGVERMLAYLPPMP